LIVLTGLGTSEIAQRDRRESLSQRISSPALEHVVSIPVANEIGGRETPGAAPRQAQARSEFVDRVVNTTIASLGLILAAPVMILFALLVKLTSPGPIFYTQARVGLNRRRAFKAASAYDRRTRDLGGRPFMIMKFRTMQVGAEKNGAQWAVKRDARVTAVGRVMRKYRIDELPQLVNVIRGEMNIVGPRPERPSIFSRLCDDIAEYPLRQSARPGITGWAQVNQAYDTNLDDVKQKVRYDLEYIERQGVAQDLMIMARTVPVMIFRKGGW
jgi:lipopolysaccharide/colanic/teichoic acid biosynthesis glycosyltransferase